MSKGSQFQAMDSYFQSLLSEETPVVSHEGPVMSPPAQPAPIQEADAATPVVDYAEPVETKVNQAHLAELLAKVEQQAAAKVAEPKVAAAPVVRPHVPPPPIWKNIEVEREFQALFFVVSGITFAVPLTELGGIHELGKLNSLFGKPDWFKGVMMMREQQLNVVDSTKWIMPGREAETEYQYLVMLGNSPWGLACHQLIGTELLSRDRIQWRESAGKRPWLAGMVKDKMCALLHVKELQALLDKGLNIEGH